MASADATPARRARTATPATVTGLPDPDEETTRRIRLLRSILRTMVLVSLVGLIGSLLDRHNDPWVTVAVYLVLFLAILWLSRAVRRRQATLVAWVLSTFFWVVIAFVTLFFGGMRGSNAGTFGVCVLLVGGVVGGRAAVAVAVISSAWCGFVALLELHDALPPQLGPYTPINGWIGVTVSLILMSVLLRNSLDSLREMHAKAEASALQRDEALRRSIQAQKMELVGNLVTGVAHDFNNLLMIVAMSSRSAQQDLGDDRGGVGPLFDDLDDATSRAGLLTRQLLSFARTKPDDLATVDLGEQVRSFALLLPRLMGAAVTVTLELEPGAIVRASRVGLEQVLLNLVVNARDAMPDGGRLTLRVRGDEHEVRLEVEDTGLGMDAATRDRIFTPFFTTKATGTGLGLATVRERVTQSGGTIDVTSEPGRGTTFAIRFPRAEPAPSPDAAPAASAPTPPPAPAQATVQAAASARPALLIVEDQAVVRRALTRLFEQAGFEVVGVKHGGEALELLERAHAFVAVVSDVQMPVLDGEALAARLAATSPDLPLILLSGSRAVTTAALGPRQIFLEKPVDGPRLVGAIEQLLGWKPGARG